MPLDLYLKEEDCASRMFKKVSMQWNAHLFVRTEKNSRDCPYPVAAVVEVPPAVKQIPAD